MTHLHKTLLLLTCGTSMLAFQARAQIAERAVPLPQAGEAAPVSADDVVVTGSRVITNGNSSPSPVTVVPTREILQVQPGSTLADALNTLPVFAGSRGGVSNPTTTGTGSGGNGSANQLNLRNLGATRTLVLMDGRRVPPTLFNGIVDVDIIPQALVQRVDIVTGGVSAVYGSDAIAGVVNYVIDRKLQGFRADVSSGISRYGDGSRIDLAFAYGVSLGERAHVEASYEYRDEGGIARRSSRPWFNRQAVVGTGTAAAPYQLLSNLTLANTPFGGRINSGALSGQYFATDGVLSPVVNGTATATAGVQVGGSGGYYDSSLLGALEGHQAFARFDYELADAIHAHAQFSGNFKTNTNYADIPLLTNVTISRTNAFLPSAVQALIPTTQPTFTFGKLINDAPRVRADADTDQRIYSGGLEGRSGGWNWSVDYRHGDAILGTTLHNVVNRQRLSAALDAVNSGGRIVCNVTVTNPGLADDCVPLNVFGPTASSTATPAALSYILGDVHYRAKTTMDAASGQVAGTLFSNWAGPVGAALSGEWRKTSFSSTSTGRPDQFLNCTGLRYNCSATGQLWDQSFAPSGTVMQKVWEVAGELDLPLLRDKRFFQDLSLNGAVRYADYANVGDATTWKIGVNWALSDSLRLRATRSRDFRAPTLYDLYAPPSGRFRSTTDVLTGATVNVLFTDLANPDLQPEVGNTLTAGLVWKPAGGLSIALDAYDIKVTNAITLINGSDATFQRVCYASGGASFYCSLQSRPSGFGNTNTANNATAFFTRSYNIALVHTMGLDLEVNYNRQVFDRPFQARVLTSWQPHIYYDQPDLNRTDQGGAAFGPQGMQSSPAWRVVGFLRFSPADSFTIDLMERWRSAMKLGGDPVPVWVNNHIDDFATTNVNLTWSVRPQMDFYFNVQNLFDADPPPGAATGSATTAGIRDGFAIGDDPRGRYVTAGARIRF